MQKKSIELAEEAGVLVSKLVDFSAREIRERYMECDKLGHYAPDNPREDFCGHCFRRLEYVAYNVQQILGERRNVPIFQQPLDAPVLSEQRDREIEGLKFDDWCFGLKEIFYLFENT
ncbi:MAG: hypothetical protein AABX85_01935 [Nanoarchaeota archaeon]